MHQLKVHFIQNILAPYRRPLFEAIAAHPGIQFTLVLHGRCEPHRNCAWALDNACDYGYNIHVVKSLRKRKNGYDPFIYLSYDFFFYLLKSRPDVIVCTGFSPATIQSYLYCKMLGKKYLIWNEGTEHTERGMSRLRLQTRIVLAKHASSFVVAGEQSREYVERALGRTGPFFTSYNCNNSTQICRQTHAHTRTTRRANILFTGNLMKMKGVWELVRAFEKARSRNGECALYLLGSGEEEANLKMHVRRNAIDNVYFLGFLPFQDSIKYWRIADVLVQLSHFDCNPLVITEALAAGLPIVCSRHIGSHPDFVHHGKNGYVVDPFDVEQVVKAIEHCLAGNKDGSMSWYSLKLSQKLTYENAASGFVQAINHSFENKCQS